MARTTPITVRLLDAERFKGAVVLLAEILAEYDRQMAAEPWRASRGVGYADVQIDTVTADEIRKILRPADLEDTAAAASPEPPQEPTR